MSNCLQNCSRCAENEKWRRRVQLWSSDRAGRKGKGEARDSWSDSGEMKTSKKLTFSWKRNNFFKICEENPEDFLLKLSFIGNIGFVRITELNSFSDTHLLPLFGTQGLNVMVFCGQHLHLHCWAMTRCPLWKFSWKFSEFSSAFGPSVTCWVWGGPCWWTMLCNGASDWCSAAVQCYRMMLQLEIWCSRNDSNTTNQ